MKFKTFISIYYAHRLKKGSIIKRLYIYILLPFLYLINKFFFPKIIDLELYKLKNSHLFEKFVFYLYLCSQII